MVDPEYLKDIEDTTLEPPKRTFSHLIAKWFLVMILLLETIIFAYFIITSYQIANVELDIWHYKTFATFKRGQVKQICLKS